MCDFGFAGFRAGRPSSLNSNATSHAPGATVTRIGYASSNALNTETYGNSLIHPVSYNNRLQPTEIKLGTSSNSTSVIDLNYSYGTTANNGDVLSASYSGGGLSYTQSFGYDSLNRLTTSVESGSSWSQTNGYDQYGNRWIDYGGGSHSLAFSTSTNRITTAGFSYDANGNLTNDTIHTYAFDAENKISKVDSSSAYTYDGEGHRIRKLVGENRRFIYGIGGQLVAEFDGSTGNLKKEYSYGGATLVTIEPTSINSNGAQYTTSDHLGSPRVVTNSSAAVVSRHDYMPFGEELAAGTGGRTTGLGFSNSGDNNRKKFTGYERDTETGLDFAQARYYSNTQGRFTSPDPFAGSATIGNPQTFNRYAYCGNNPVNLTDPLGMVAQPGGRNLSNWSGGMAAEEASDGLSQWDDSPAQEQPAAEEATRDAAGSSSGDGTFAIDDGSNDGAGTAVAAESSPLGQPQDSDEAQFYYWSPYKDSKRGHVGLRLGDGTTYISYWPTNEDEYHGIDPPILRHDPARPSNYDEDKAGEGNRDPEVIRIGGLDQAAIKKWWNNGKGHGDFSIWHNCSDIVAEALRVGGLPIRGSAFLTTPADVKGEVERLLHERQYPPPIPKPAPAPAHP